MPPSQSPQQELTCQAVPYLREPVRLASHALRVLIVDDDPDTLECMAALLDHEGFEVIVAGGGQEAIELARLRPPDAIFLDIRMPHVDGLQTAEAILAWGHVPA